jgi:hypothetical protein
VELDRLSSSGVEFIILLVEAVREKKKRRRSWSRLESFTVLVGDTRGLGGAASHPRNCPDTKHYFRKEHWIKSSSKYLRPRAR